MKSNQEWRRWGDTDPLFAVASWPGKQKGASAAWTDAEFYALGESDWQDFGGHWEQFGLVRDHCVEIGCGAGRITRQLGRAFKSVSALDVSRQQIDYARTRMESSNITFHETNGTAIPLSDASADAVFSCHVFQHFDCPSDAVAVFDEVERILAPGGSLMVHLPLVHLPDFRGFSVIRRCHGVLDRIKAWKAAVDRRRGRLIMRMLCYDSSCVLATLRGLGFCRVEFRSFAVRSNGAFHDFVFAMKAQRGC